VRGLKRPGRSSSFAHADRLPYFHGLRWRRAPCMTAVAFRLACEGKGMAGPSFWSFSAKDGEPPAPAMHEQRVTARCRCKPAADRGLLDIARAARAFRLVHDLALVDTVASLSSGTPECHQTKRALRLARSAAAAAVCSVDYLVCQGQETT